MNKHSICRPPHWLDHHDTIIQSQELHNYMYEKDAIMLQEHQSSIHRIQAGTGGKIVMSDFGTHTCHIPTHVLCMHEPANTYVVIVIIVYNKLGIIPMNTNTSFLGPFCT